MTQLIVRKLEPELVAKLKERAGKLGHSAEEEHRQILRKALLENETEEGQATFEHYLRSMPDVGHDEDFARIEGALRDLDLSA